MSAPLPEFDDAISTDAYQRLSALERFVYDWQSGNSTEQWRADLQAALAEEIAAAQQEAYAEGRADERDAADAEDVNQQWAEESAQRDARIDAAIGDSIGASS